MGLRFDLYKYLFKTKTFISYLSSAVIGIRDGKQINYNDFSILRIPCPPLDEQRRMSCYHQRPQNIWVPIPYGMK